jgi:hypothetical protein
LLAGGKSDGNRMSEFSELDVQALTKAVVRAGDEQDVHDADSSPIAVALL